MTPKNEDPAMPQNKIRFQPGMPLSELIERFGTEAQCEAALERARWLGGDYIIDSAAIFAKACFGHPSPSKRQKSRGNHCLRRPQPSCVSRPDPTRGRDIVPQ